MDALSFEEIYERLRALYQQEAYDQALTLATEALEAFPEQRILLDYWRMTMAARTGDNGQALQVLQNALENGQWYSEQILRRSPSFKALQGEQAFEALVLQNQANAEQDQEHNFPVFTLRPEGRCQAGGPPCRLLIGLHANAATVQASLGFWREAATAGWLVAALQSSQAIWKGAYVWDDREIAEQQVRRHYAAIEENYAIDPRQTALAGHSLGGELAIWMALKGSLPTRGFLAIGPGGPWMDNLEPWQVMLSEREGGDLRGYIIVGEDDPSIPHENIQTLVEWLNRAGVRCGYESVVGVEHDYTPEYNPAIQRGLEFIS